MSNCNPPHTVGRRSAIARNLRLADRVLARRSRAVFEAVEPRMLFSAGLVYSLNTLETFDGNVGGGNPTSNLVMDASGNLFGATSTGGANNGGTVFEIPANGGSFDVLASFDNNSGVQPGTALAIDSNGDLFGTTTNGGGGNLGAIWELPAGGNSLEQLASFSSGTGYDADGGLTIDAAGNLYGTAAFGGANNGGDVFEYDPNNGTVTDIADFDNTTGYQPNAPLILDSAGNLFGTTSFGGDSNAGTVFELPANSGAIQTVASLNWSTTGGQPNSGLVEDASGNLYGTAQYGGTNNAGAVYEVSSSGSISGVASFDWSNTGGAPSAGLSLDSSGDLFGTTTSGGSGNCGTVFEIPAGTGSISPLFSFNGADGDSGFNFGGWGGGGMNQIMPGVVVDSSGNIYGEAAGGGGGNLGTVYELTGSVPTATQAVFTTPPAGSFTAGASQSATVSLETSGGAVDTSNSSVVTLSIASGPDGATIGGRLSATAVNGVATFSGLTFDTAGMYTLTATSTGGLTSATSGSFTVIPDTASQLVITANPNTTAVAGQSTGTVTADVEDQFGNVVTTDTSTVGITTGTTLHGVTSAAAVAGVATFSGLSIDSAGQYSLTLADGGLTSATTSQVAVSPDAAAQLVLVQQPGGTAVAGQTVGTIIADVEDQFGNIVTTDTSAVSITTTATLHGVASTAAVAGVATFSGLSINTAGQYSLTLADDGLTSATTSTVAITPDAAEQLVLAEQPNGSAVAGHTVGTIVADVEDQFGNVVTTDTSTVGISSGITLHGVTSTAAVAGVATFAGLSINTVGQYSLTLADNGLSSATTSSVTITPDAASQLVLTEQPNGTVVAGQTVGTIMADVEDQYGNVVTADTSAVSITNGATLHGVTSAAALAGVVSFAGLSIDTTGQYSLMLADDGMTSAVTSQVAVTPDTAAKLILTQQPNGTAVAGQSIGTVTADIEDQYGNVVTTETSTVGISTGTTLHGTVSAAAIAGVATFTGLSINTTGQYSLTLAENGLTSATTDQVTVTPAAASKLVVVHQPSGSAVAGQSVGTVTADVEDQYGNVVTTDTSTVAIATGATLHGTVSAAAVAGVATFTGLSISTAGSYSLTLAETGLTSATTAQVTITPAAASKLVLVHQPNGSAVAGQLLGTITADIEDQYGNVVTTDTSTVGISTGTTLHGTVSAAAIAGVATFTGLSINTTGQYSLTLAETGLTSATTDQVTVTPAAASKLVLVHQPNGSAVAGQSLGTITADVEDQYGNVVTTDNSTVGISTGTTLHGTANVAAIAGVATFTGVLINTAGQYLLNLADNILTPATTCQITVVPAAASQLVVTDQPSGSTIAGQSVGTTTITIEDAYGNIVTTDTSPVTLASTTSLNGTTTVNAAKGVASFSDVSITTVGSYALNVTDAGLTPTTTTAVVISPAAAAQLVLTGQPAGSAIDGKPLGTITVDVEDAFGNLVTDDASPVTLSSTVALTGSTTAGAVNGVATFSDISIPVAGIYTLTASDGGLTPATSGAVTITPGVVQTAGKTLTTWTVNLPADLPPTTVVSKWLTVRVTSQSGGGTTLMTTRIPVKHGVANFKGLNLHKAGVYNLTATDAAGNTVTRQITVVAAAPTHLAFSTAPGQTGISSTVVVRAVDRYGNTTTTSDGTAVSLKFVKQAGYLSIPTLTGSVDAILTGGTAVFPDVVVTGHGHGRLIAAADRLGIVRAGFYVVP